MEAGDGEGGARRSWGRSLRTVFGWGLAALYLGWIVGQIARDRTLITALGFYVPSPVLVFLLIVASGFAFVRGKRGRAALGLLLAAPALVTIIVQENQWSGPEVAAPGSGEVVRVLHWNVNGGLFGWDRAVSEMVAAEADLILISESPSGVTPPKVREWFGESYRGIRFGRLHALTRGGLGGLGEREWIYRADGLQVGRFTWKVGSRTLELFLIDIRSNPLTPRDPLLRALRALIEERQPDLVVGDFNSPRRSLALDPLPTSYAHAYHVAGQGWSYTWPTPIPVYALDHMLVRDTVRVLEYRLETSFASDHRRQILELEISAGPR